MRRIAAAALSAAALSATLFATAGTASADTAHRVGSPAGDGAGATSRAVTGGPTRIGKVHRFKVPGVRGTSAWGDWYWAKSNGHSFVVLDFYIKDTRSDGKSAGLCYDLVSPVTAVHNKCLVNTLGAGKTKHFPWQMGYWNKDKLRVRTAVGHLDSKANIYYTTVEGRWFKLR